MENGQLYLVNVSWRAPDEIGDMAPGTLPIPIAFDPAESCYEASIPAYARDAGLEMQLAVKSLETCVIIGPHDATVPMFEVVHADTGDHWWIEKGPWERRGNNEYHDAPSFHRPGGAVDIRVGDSRCRVHLYDPSMTSAEFALLLDDIKNWCWRMAIDESCYVTVEHESDVRVLSTEFLALTEDFLRHMTTLLELPHCELRESIEIQRIDRLRPNNHSLRYLAQRGERTMVPGRSARHHYDTPENRFAHAMLKRVISMLRWTANAAQDGAARFERTAAHYEERAAVLRTRTTERIDPGILDENLRRVRSKRHEVQMLLNQGQQMILVTSKPGYWLNTVHGRYNGLIAMVHLGTNGTTRRLREFITKCNAAMVFGTVTVELRHFKNGNPFNWCEVTAIHTIDVWRDYDLEVSKLETSRLTLEGNNWELTLPHQIREERAREAKTLSQRVDSLRAAATRTSNDAETAAALLLKASMANRRATDLGISSDSRFVPTMVFLQSPPYAGALSTYRQLLSMAGVDDTTIDGLLALEGVGLRDWPTVYERWCLVSLIRVLQDDFRFVFDTDEIKARLLRHCTGQMNGTFSVTARRDDMNLELTLNYQATLKNGRVPDFLLQLKDTANATEINCVLDAKSCAFQHRPPDAAPNPWIYLDDCLDELVHKKDYGQSGTNSVFIMHSVNECHCLECTNIGRKRGPVTQPTTLQSWASASSYGGDMVFSWETAKPEHHHGAVLIRPGDMDHLKRVVLMLIQFGLARHDICASCGSGGEHIQITDELTAGGNTKRNCLCRKCQFLSVRTICVNCKKRLFKNQAWWTYHDQHPTDLWNMKCWACGSLL